MRLGCGIFFVGLLAMLPMLSVAKETRAPNAAGQMEQITRVLQTYGVTLSPEELQKIQQQLQQVEGNTPVEIAPLPSPMPQPMQRALESLGIEPNP